MDEVDARVLAAFPHRVWNCSTTRLGYSGTALFSRVEPIATWSDPVAFSVDDDNFEEFAREVGRCKRLKPGDAVESAV